METRTLGSLTVSLVGLGCNNFGGRIDADATRAVVDACLDAGITLFDTADVYGGTKSEEFLGQALAGRRDQAIVATKFGAPLSGGTGGAKASYVAQCAEDSLRRLDTDHIDLYQIHRPDPETPIEETLGALNQLVVDGKVREIGCSNFSPEQIEEAAKASDANGWVRFVTVQNQLNLLQRKGDAELVAACQQHDLKILPYFPLASGMLTGKYKRGEEPPEGTRLAGTPAERRERAMSDRIFDKVEALTSLAESRGHTLLELAMSWLATMPAMGSVIAGATKPDQVRSNAESVAWQLTDEDRAEIDRITA